MFSFVTRVNLLHPGQSLFLYGLLISLWCFFYRIILLCQASFSLKVTLYIAKTNQNTIKIR